jgi:hypothetical protein
MNRTKKIKYADIFTPQMIAHYQQDIIGFVEDMIFQGDPDLFLSEHQKEFLLSIQNRKRTSAKSGKGVGKTSSISFAILWFLCVWESPKIVCTAPSFPTLKSALWPEVALWLNRSVFKDIFEHTSERLYLIEKPKNWWAEPRTARDKESMQGLHAKNMLILVDEASGVADDIIETCDTTLTSSNNKVALVGNPTRVTGFFFDTFNKFKHRWNTLTFNAEESPFVKKEQIEYYAEKYGVNHPLYLVNVKGEFPEGNPDSFINLSDVSDAVNRTVVPIGVVEIGCDVARFGDDSTVVYWRHGNKVYPAKTMPQSSIPEVVDLVLKTVIEARSISAYTDKIKVKVDDSGVGGGVTDYLELDRKHNIEVVPCNFGGKGNDIYHNETSIMWGNLKDHIRLLDLPDDSKLVEELSARRWALSPSGKIALEPKSQFKKDFKSSPDRADALVLCFAQKEPERKVLNKFDTLDPDIIKDHFSYTGEDKFCSIFITNDLLVSILYCIWNGNNIYVYDEHVGDESLVHIAYMIKEHGKMTRTIGNSSMFGKLGEDIASKFRKYKLNVSENITYNELGAIEMLGVLTSQKRILIQKNCVKTIEQLGKWKLDGKKRDQEISFGLCYALTNIISFLKRKLEYKPIIQYYTPYSNDKDEFLKGINKETPKVDGWMAV